MVSDHNSILDILEVMEFNVNDFNYIAIPKIKIPKINITTQSSVMENAFLKSNFQSNINQKFIISYLKKNLVYVIACYVSILSRNSSYN
jgi:hypothetical protein